MARSLIRSSILEGSAALIRARGGRPADVARLAGVPYRALTDPELLVPAAAVYRFFELAAEECSDRTWGLSLSVNARLAAIIGPLWVLLKNARTVGQMCEAFANNFDVFSDSASVTARTQRDGSLLLNWSVTVPDIDSAVQMLEFAVSVVAKEIRTRMGSSWTPSQVLFGHARPTGTLRVYRAVFGCDPLFNQPFDGLLIDSRTVATPLRGRATSARALARRVVELEDSIPDTAIAHRLEAVIRGLMPYAPCSLKDVSEAMGMGPRSLQIRLKRQGQSFVQIRDTVRSDLASKYLRHSNLTAQRVAEILGYGDSTSLSRSFRRWRGKSIRETRKKT